MRVAIAFAPLALLATSCGGKAADPYAKSLALGSERVEINGWVANGTKHVPISASGDFTNHPDRGTLTIHQQGATLHEVFDRNTVYLRAGKNWVSQPVNTKMAQTPAQMFRARKPARVVNGRVVHIQQTTSTGSISIDFSRYGERVSVTIPRVKGSK